MVYLLHSVGKKLNYYERKDWKGRDLIGGFGGDTFSICDCIVARIGDIAHIG